jgi:hypothetical protein
MALVTLRSYRDPIDAELARAQLDSIGINAVIVDQHLVSIQWLYSNAIGGVKVLVEQDDFDAAREALVESTTTENASLLENRLPSESGESCPACCSTAVRPSRLQRNSAAIALLTGLPLIAWRHRSVCGVCGYSWKRKRPEEWEISEETLHAEQMVHKTRAFPVIRILVATILALWLLYFIQLKILQAS